MRTIAPQSSGDREKREGPVWDFWRNVVTDAREIGPGMIMGPLMLGRDLISDAARLDPTMPRTSKTLGGMVQGFNQSSWIPSVARGDLDEAAERFHARPISGLLDLTGVAGMGASGVAKLSHAAALGAPTAASRAKLMQGAGYERIGSAKDIENINVLPDTPRYRFRTGTIVGGDVFAKPTHRRILPSKDDPLLLKDPMGSDRYDISNMDNLDPVIAERLSNLNAWKRVSRNPLWRGIGEAQAEARRQLIPFDAPLSSSKQGMRRMRRGVEKSMYLSYGTARDLHQDNNTRYMSDVAEMLRDRNIKSIDIKGLTDYTAYLAAAGYSNVGHRLSDLEGTHLGNVQAIRAANKRLEEADAGKQADAIRATVKDLKAKGYEMEDPRIVELRRDLHAQEKRRERARAERAASIRYMQKRDAPTEPYGADDPRSGYKEEMKFVDKINSKYPGLIDEIMSSDSMERFLDRLELASQQSEALAIKNYGRGLNAKEAIHNRYRMADLYQSQGINDETKKLYSRQRKNGRGVRSPIFIPMRSKKHDARKFQEGKDRNPFMEKAEDVVGDPLDLELWNQNARNPISGGLFLKKHAEELRDYHMNRHLDMAYRLAIPMPRKQAESWRMIDRHEGNAGLTIALPNGRPSDMSSPFIDIGEFAQEIDQLRSSTEQIGNSLRRLGYNESASYIDRASATMAAATGGQKPKTRLDRGISVRQAERTRGLEGGMTVILPTPVYGSIVNDMIHTAQLINEIDAAPSVRKSFEGGLDTAMKYWRYSVLHTRPKWMFNNALGSVYMAAMQEGWLPALTNIIRTSTALNWARKFLGIKPKDYKRGGSKYINEIVENRMSDVLYTSGSTSMFGRGDRGLDVVNRVDDLMGKVASFNSRIADNPPRLARVFTVLDEMVDNHIDHQRALGKKVTKSRDELRLDIVDNPHSRERLAQTVLEDMIDFQDLSDFERKIVTYAMPFYSWIKGSSKASMRHIADQPSRLMFQKELGLEAGRQVEEQFPGGVPSYLLSSLPGGWTGNEPRKVVNFAGASPAQTLFDVTAMAPAFFGGVPQQFGTESPLGMMNPFISAGVAGMTYRHPFYGTPFSRDMLVPEVAMETTMPPFLRSLYKSGFDAPGPIGPMRQFGLWGDPYATSGKEIARHDPMSYWKRLIGPMEQEIMPANARTRYKEELTDLGY